MNEQHIIELSHRYQIVVSDRGFMVNQLMLNQNGQYEIQTKQHCPNFESVIQYLEQCELSQEDVLSLQDCKKVQQAILAEIRDVICRSQSY